MLNRLSHPSAPIVYLLYVGGSKGVGLSVNIQVRSYLVVESNSSVVWLLVTSGVGAVGGPPILSFFVWEWPQITRD